MTSKQPQHNRLKARKVPRQSRSRSTVDAIKQAARDLIAAEGFSSHSTSTTAIAERAGVSVGSLYDYFPTREAIFLALFEDTTAQVTVIMKREMVRIFSQPLALAFPRLLRKLIVLLREHEVVMLRMVTRMPELKLVSQPLSFENMVLDTTRVAINQWNPGLSAHDLDRRAFLLREIILGCVYRYLNDAPENVTDRAIIADLAQIAAHYIALPPKKANT